MINKFVKFALNFPAQWVLKCYSGKVADWMVNHLIEKWEYSYSRGGASSALIYFYSSLDGTNAAIFDKYLEGYDA
jgi:hypothetical protein